MTLITREALKDACEHLALLIDSHSKPKGDYAPAERSTLNKWRRKLAAYQAELGS